MTRYAVCIRNAGYEASLRLRKSYRVVPDVEAIKHGLVRVVDESGEDYLYPQDYFVLERPRNLRRGSNRPRSRQLIT